MLGRDHSPPDGVTRESGIFAPEHGCADLGVDSIGTDHDVEGKATPVDEFDLGAISSRDHFPAFATQMDLSRPDSVSEYPVKVGSMKMEIGGAELTFHCFTQWLAGYERSVIPSTHVAGEGSDSDPVQFVPEAEADENSTGVGADLDPRSDLSEDRGGLIHLDLDADTTQRQGRGESTDACPDDGSRHSSRSFSVGFGVHPLNRSCGCRPVRAVVPATVHLMTSPHYGILSFATDQTTPPHIAAAACEAAGFESVWFPEHSHLPLASGGWPDGDDIPVAYARTIDQWVALGAAAAATSTIRLGTGMCLVPQHDPIWLAKQAASLDHLSGGRLLLGIGYVWNRAELEHHGIDFSSRRQRTRECIEVMRALWTDEVASYAGSHFRFDDSRVWPKPIQSPGPPILIGAGAGPRTIADLAAFADGWAPMYGRNDITGQLPAVKAALERAGRDPGAFELSVFGVPPKREAIEEVVDWGATRIVFGAGGADESALVSHLEAITSQLL